MATVPRSTEAERHDHLLAELLGHVTEYNPDADSGKIQRAFDYACDHHQGQLRKSGEDFVDHPVAVAVICADLKLDTATIARRCCTTWWRTPRPSSSTCASCSATRSPCWSTASPS